MHHNPCAAQPLCNIAVKLTILLRMIMGRTIIKEPMTISVQWVYLSLFFVPLDENVDERK